MKRQKGFSLLEVIVALVLIASVGLGLYAWINSALFSLSRVQEHTQRREAVLNALAFMESINPMERPTGEAPVGLYTVIWEARPMEPPRNGSRGSVFLVGLYKTHVQVRTEDMEMARFDLRQVGYRQVVKLEFLK